ncbi:MAG: hydroxymethylglutaryl-CoA lyase [Acidobacteria bacterium]|nr:MAG: hydroxymethylglutaryl-CoA lyase [Acidobacteriota bacterium]
MEKVKIVECPRDAWQGLDKIIPTEAKAAYLRRLIESGFRHIDAVSFVAPKYVPQTADSEAVMRSLAGSVLKPNGSAAKVEIIGIVVNARGIERAFATPGVTTLGYPYSVSAHFRRTNSNMSQSESRRLVEKLVPDAERSGRKLVAYVSMAFGNPWDEPWGAELVEEAVRWLVGAGVKTISLADTAGVADARGVGDLVRTVKPLCRDVELGVHLHSRPESAGEKVEAAFDAGCRRFDSALTGLGGCPFAGDALVGNIPTEVVVATLAEREALTGIEPWALLSAVEATRELRQQYAP